ncbi:UNVERIFIED_CONTAM: hypothetical protein Slati_1997700 [Sesamum latifolium]|uniref:Uncharacterized protein n=1 Tax=Sesamum latifolium TaxID=2727402 RepID=A0AAW2WLM8_9LAMI
MPCSFYSFLCFSPLPSPFMLMKRSLLTHRLKPPTTTNTTLHAASHPPTCEPSPTSPPAPAPLSPRPTHREAT